MTASGGIWRDASDWGNDVQLNNVVLDKSSFGGVMNFSPDMTSYGSLSTFTPGSIPGLTFTGKLAARNARKASACKQHEPPPECISLTRCCRLTMVLGLFARRASTHSLGM